MTDKNDTGLDPQERAVRALEARSQEPLTPEEIEAIASARAEHERFKKMMSAAGFVSDDPPEVS